MKKGFDTFWNDSVRQWRETECPIPDERIEEMAQRATRGQSELLRPSAEGYEPNQPTAIQPLPRRHRTSRRAVWAAACITLALLTARVLYALQPHATAVQYCGQTVQYCCNHPCDTACIMSAVSRFVDIPQPRTASLQPPSSASAATLGSSPLMDCIINKNL